MLSQRPRPLPWTRAKTLALASSLAALTLGCGTLTQAASLNDADARRFLAQASFGPDEASVAALKAQGKSAWLQNQFAQSASGFPGYVYMDPSTKIGCPAGSPATCNRDNYTVFPLQLQFFRNGLNGPDALRQRVALALSEILVVSGQQIRQPYAMAAYQNLLLNNAFGNFRTLLREVTLSPAMGTYLNMVNNDKPNPSRGLEPNENYAREVLQLFSIGLWQLNPDGSYQLDAKGALQTSYDQEAVEGFAHAFTGWTYAPRPGGRDRFPNPRNFEGAMQAYADHHDTAAKRLLNGVTLPPGQSAAADLDGAINNIFQHPNVGPFIGRQLIQHLVTSNPSPAYVARVTAVFNGSNGSPRGDMKAVIAAILLDPEASQPSKPAEFGKLREPVLLLLHTVRALGGQSDGVWLRAQAAALGQSVFSPPSVFNFFPPDYPLPDDPNLDGPAFGVYNASTAFTWSGVVAALLNPVGIPADPSVPGSTGTRIDFSRWQALAADPAALVQEIQRVLFAGQMSASLQQNLTRAAQLAPASKPLDRARAALQLALLSPEYLVEH